MVVAMTAVMNRVVMTAVMNVVVAMTLVMSVSGVPVEESEPTVAPVL